jgi:hypothetical protein
VLVTAEVELLLRSGDPMIFYVSAWPHALKKQCRGGSLEGRAPEPRRHILPFQRTNPFPLWNDPEFYSVSKADSRAFGAGHLDLAVVEHIPSARLVFDQFVRFDNLNPPGAH